ncbi:MAG: DUF547 domain-containing protein [Candidatus Electrothrix sp. AR3]|nr:DUF547 domain-containing protein [Candidatus Electrothrix sp. AR3]
MKTTLVLFFTGFLLFFSGNGRAAADDHLNHSIFADLLGKYVQDGVVDYQGFQDEEMRLDTYLQLLEQTDSSTLTRNERFAFYINAYNAWTIKLILSKYPKIKSIKELGTLFQGPWKKKICRIDKEIFSLDHLEHKILRPLFKDPRVHFALNCASKGCPVLRAEPYIGSELETQLASSARIFINDPTKNFFQGTTLYLSSIFKWFPEDFNHYVFGFVKQYASGKLKEELIGKAGNKVQIEYLEYDWSLNGK